MAGLYHILTKILRIALYNLKVFDKKRTSTYAFNYIPFYSRGPIGFWAWIRVGLSEFVCLQFLTITVNILSLEIATSSVPKSTNSWMVIRPRVYLVSAFDDFVFG